MGRNSTMKGGRRTQWISLLVFVGAVVLLLLAASSHTFWAATNRENRDFHPSSSSLFITPSNSEEATPREEQPNIKKVQITSKKVTTSAHHQSGEALEQQQQEGKEGKEKEELSFSWTTETPTVNTHRPKHLVEALEEYHRAKSEQEGEKDGGGNKDNSVAVSQEDLDRSQNAYVRRLPSLLLRDGGGAPSVPSDLISTSFKDWVDRVALFMQNIQVDASPIIVDLGCTTTVTAWLSILHPNSTVLCVYKSPRAADALRKKTKATNSSATTKFITSPDGVEELSSDFFPAALNRGGRVGGKTTTVAGSGKSTRSNFIPAVVPQLFEGNFMDFFKTCNIISTSFFFQRTTMFKEQCKIALSALLSNSKTAFLWLSPECVTALEDYEAGSTNYEGSTLKITTQMIGRINGGGGLSRSGGLHCPAHWGHCSFFSVVVIESQRTCAKTFGAPAKQWDRTLMVQYNRGKVTFRVSSSKGDLARTIHPLQYLPSVNLDTLLGVGIDTTIRRQWLGQMVTVPRYSDPLPHNWVMVGAGELVRIDKYDATFDRKVDEAKGYWGRATRGYLHLLGHHLCLSIDSRVGLPSAITTGIPQDCVVQCQQCSETCSYLPKGNTPCKPCRHCGQCAELSGPSWTTVKAGLKCQMTYSSMDQARRVWKQWEKADKKHISNSRE